MLFFKAHLCLQQAVDLTLIIYLHQTTKNVGTESLYFFSPG